VRAPVLALDIGGTKLSVGLVAGDGNLLASVTRLTEPRATPTRIVETLFAMAEEAQQQAGLAEAAVQGVGVSFGGPVDFPSGTTVTCHHLPGWEGVPLRDLIAARAGQPTAMDNDANAAALGETVFGAAVGCAHVLYLTVSTGIGGGLVLNGRLHRGANSMAGEIGHTLVLPEGPVCTCGRNGCLEAVASGPAIARAAREAMTAGGHSSLCRLDAEALTAKDVAEAAATDELAARIMAQAGEYLGTAIAGAANLVNPEMVVIGGGVSQAGECLFAPMREAVAWHGVLESVRELRLVPAALGAQSALYGAAALGLGY
jgi:glucokinase